MGRFDHLRHAALELLDAGNSTASVSQLLAVPATVIMRWRDEPVPAGAAQPTGRGRASGRRGHDRPLVKTLVVRRGAPGGLSRLARVDYFLGAFAIAFAGLAWCVWTRADGFINSMWFELSPLVALVLLWLARNRVLFKLDAHGIVVPGLLRTRRMAYAEVADWWLVLHVRDKGSRKEVEGSLLTLQSKVKGTLPIEVFVGEHVVIDPAVLERLEPLKKVNRGVGPLTPMGSIPKD